MKRVSKVTEFPFNEIYSAYTKTVGASVKKCRKKATELHKDPDSKPISNWDLYKLYQKDCSISPILGPNGEGIEISIVGLPIKRGNYSKEHLLLNPVRSFDQMLSRASPKSHRVFNEKSLKIGCYDAELGELGIKTGRIQKKFSNGYTCFLTPAELPVRDAIWSKDEVNLVDFIQKFGLFDCHISFLLPLQDTTSIHCNSKFIKRRNLAVNYIKTHPPSSTHGLPIKTYRCTCEETELINALKSRYPDPIEMKMEIPTRLMYNVKAKKRITKAYFENFGWHYHLNSPCILGVPGFIGDWLPHKKGAFGKEESTLFFTLVKFGLSPIEICSALPSRVQTQLPEFLPDLEHVKQKTGTWSPQESDSLLKALRTLGMSTTTSLSELKKFTSQSHIGRWLALAVSTRSPTQCIQKLHKLLACRIHIPLLASQEHSVSSFTPTSDSYPLKYIRPRGEIRSAEVLRRIESAIMCHGAYNLHKETLSLACNLPARWYSSWIPNRYVDSIVPYRNFLPFFLDEKILLDRFYSLPISLSCFKIFFPGRSIRQLRNAIQDSPFVSTSLPENNHVDPNLLVDLFMGHGADWNVLSSSTKLPPRQCWRLVKHTLSSPGRRHYPPFLWRALVEKYNGEVCMDNLPSPNKPCTTIEDRLKLIAVPNLPEKCRMFELDGIEPLPPPTALLCKMVVPKGSRHMKVNPPATKSHTWA
ncbi:hypothetical protein DSO57_1026906 [Entomophthora muscae]|uniref:Uncharacterized protein n=1 Tax=Entomophthora muscae TaxID=34485 RepID=A0ACC2UMP6_9FUNG|nr:hypothetical protein DSO57_1026906 [Entomophthora muscae]